MISTSTQGQTARKRTPLALLVCAALVAGCAQIAAPTKPAVVTKPKQEVQATTISAPMRWDFRPEADFWTQTAVKSLRAHGQPLVTQVPADITAYCPKYPTASRAEREAFWAGLLSALAKHESTWRPEAIGGGDKWYGLLQISPATARGYGCRARSGKALLDGAANLSCGIRIMAVTVLRDNAIAANNRGIAADWTPFRKARMRAEMAEWTRRQPYCAAG